MLEQRRKQYLRILKGSQYSSLCVALIFSLSFGFGKNSKYEVLAENVPYFSIYIIIIVSIIYMVFSSCFKINYIDEEKFNLPTSKDNHIFMATSSIIIGISFFTTDLIFTKEVNVPLSIIFTLSTNIFYIPIQYLSKTTYKLINNTKLNERRTLIVGSNPRAIQFADYLSTHDVLGFKVIGFLDDTPHLPANKFLGTLDDFRTIIRETIVDAVVLHLPVRTFYDKITEIITISGEQGISVHYLNNFFEVPGCQIRPNPCGPVSALVFYSSPVEDWKMMVKRVFDILTAATILLLAAPIMLVTALAIYLEDRGPIFFVQNRIGYHKRIFKMVKFRSMKTDSETKKEGLLALNEMNGPVFKIKNDPRITRTGKIIRKFAIDELPQLFNVLRGDMSIVGPRPLPLEDYEKINADWTRKRFTVRPGITCTWQCARNRNAISYEDWMKMDMEYIATWTLKNDILICLKTVPAILSGTGC